MSFLQQKYGDEIAASLEEILRVRHGLDFSPQAIEMQDELEVPLAQGAGRWRRNGCWMNYEQVSIKKISSY